MAEKAIFGAHMDIFVKGYIFGYILCIHGYIWKRLYNWLYLVHTLTYLENAIYLVIFGAHMDMFGKG